MTFNAEHIPIENTGFFSTIVRDYIDGAKALESFYSFSPNVEGIAKAIKARENSGFNRSLLTNHLQEQYSGVELLPPLAKNIELLNNSNTYTVCTAHQPNIFTGHLYFVYKIIHAIRLASFLSEKLPDYNFVPVFYMGTEDADLEELGKVEIEGKVYKWETDQKGAVGRMKVDKALLDLLQEMAAQVSVLPYGEEIISLLRRSYSLNETIEVATFKLVNELFGRFGLIILLPDNANLKRSFSEIILKELQQEFSSKAVNSTVKSFPEKYKIQAGGRSINLFYLNDQVRERIEKVNHDFNVNNSEIRFSEAEIVELVESNPERFSPNVILRPVYQELLLPNVAFIGGGGELAYWLELKKVFEEAGVPMPVLVLRNSFTIIRKKIAEQISKWDIEISDLFLKPVELANKIIAQSSSSPLNLEVQRKSLDEIFGKISSIAGNQDNSLQKHVGAIHHSLLDKITALEKKMKRAARKRETDSVNQVNNIYNKLFPHGSLQERVDNIIPFYCLWGPQIFDALLQHSGSFEQNFTVLTEQ